MPEVTQSENATVTVDFSGMEKFRKMVAVKKHGSSGPIRAMLKQWARRYRSFLMERYDSASKGDGKWQALAPSTVARRRKQSDTILRDTNTLFRAVDPDMPNAAGSLIEMITDGVRVGYGGGSLHPDGFVSIAQLALWHQTGAGNYPARPIVVDPDDRTREGMRRDAEEAMKEISKQTDTL